jgi:TatD DNase family protein
MNTIQLIDTHTHPQLDQYKDDRQEVLARARESGIGMICVGVDLQTSAEAVGLAEQHENIWASVGLHPNDNLAEVYENTPYRELAQSDRVVAIGEIGLDYYRTTDKLDRERQRDRFEKQLHLAKDLKKPVIIHCREAHEDMQEMLEAFEGERIQGVIHSFTGTWGEAERYLQLGFYIGFNGIVTFARQYDETLKAIPLDRILLETDAPFLAPEPVRGSRNEPVNLIHIAQKIGEIREVEYELIARTTTENAKRLFGI